MHFKIIAVLSILFTLSCRLIADDTTSTSSTLTFADFYRKVLAYYPQLKKQDAQIELAIAHKLQAVSGFYPRLKGISSVTTSADPVFVFGSLLRQERFTEKNFQLSRLNSPEHYTDFNFTLYGELPLFNAFQTISRVRSAQLQLKSSGLDKNLISMEVLLISFASYVQALTVDKLLLYVKKIVNDSQNDLKQAEELNAKGMILGADFYSAKVMFGNIRLLENELKQQKKNSLIIMNILMGVDPLQPLNIDGNLIKDTPEIKPLNEWITDAHAKRPDLQSIKTAIKIQKEEVFREKSTILPKISAFGSINEDSHDLRSGGENFMMGIKGEIDIFDPSYSPRITSSKRMIKKLEQDDTILKDSISKDITNEYTKYTISQVNIPVLDETLTDAQEAVNLTKPLYAEGRKSIADLIEIRYSYLTALQKYYALLSDSKNAWTRLLFLSGQLDESKMPELALNLEGKSR